MGRFYSVLYVAIVVLVSSTCLAEGLTIEEQLQDLRDNYVSLMDI